MAFFENVATPEYIPQLNCFIYETDLPYMTEDYVCNEYGDLFECIAPLKCPNEPPTYYDSLTWAMIDPVYATLVS